MGSFNKGNWPVGMPFNFIITVNRQSKHPIMSSANQFAPQTECRQTTIHRSLESVFTPCPLTIFEEDLSFN